MKSSGGYVRTHTHTHTHTLKTCAFVDNYVQNMLTARQTLDWGCVWCKGSQGELKCWGCWLLGMSPFLVLSPAGLTGWITGFRQLKTFSSAVQLTGHRGVKRAVIAFCLVFVFSESDQTVIFCSRYFSYLGYHNQRGKKKEKIRRFYTRL